LKTSRGVIDAAYCDSFGPAAGTCRAVAWALKTKEPFIPQMRSVQKMVSTHSGKLEKVRKNVLELYISDHPLDCVTCPTNGDCELQDVAQELGVEDSRYELIETLIEKVSEILLKEFKIPWVRLTISKPGAVRGSRDVGITIERGKRAD